MELLVLIDACKRASAKRITAVLPYFGYARQDRKAKSRDPITAKLVANLLTRAGADRILTMDLHADQIQGFFDIPLDHLLGINMFVAETRDLIAGHENEYVVVSPDIGFVKRSRNFAEKLGVSLAIVEKRRRFDVANVSEVLNVIGEVEGKHALMLDEMVDTAGTLCNAAQVIKDGGALDVQAFATHGLLSGSALDRLNGSVIDKLTLLDTIPAPDDKQKCGKLKYITAARHFAEAIKRIHDEASLSTLF
jgi:ribose-phosphate pyrophosphokinase